MSESVLTVSFGIGPNPFTVVSRGDDAEALRVLYVDMAANDGFWEATTLVAEKTGTVNASILESRRPLQLPVSAPERNNAPPAYNQQPQQPTTSAPAQGGLIPNITVHPFKACQCGNPLVFKKNIVGKYGPSNVFECPMRDWQDDESKKAHDSVFVKS